MDTSPGQPQTSKEGLLSRIMMRVWGPADLSPDSEPDQHPVAGTRDDPAPRRETGRE